jgi:RNA polymerase sigma-70 factor (ECF subfamily)
MPTTTDIWQEHRSRLRAYIATRVRDASAVDDILQNVFLKLHTRLDTIRSRESVMAWLYRVAANAVADHFRAAKRWQEVPIALPAAEAERNCIGELLDCIEPLLATLPETYRAAVVLSEIQSVPLKTVAETLGISLSGAKSRVQRGRAQLREKLGQCCDVQMQRGAIVGCEPRPDVRCCEFPRS